MANIFRYLVLISVFVGSLSCTDSANDLLPAEERAKAAIDELRSNLTAPINGWRLNYRPNPNSGSFLMILKFDNDGMVNIKSDVADADNNFADQTIPYRIDNSLGLELIFETYGVFHYLFEQQQASFGAEFEFIFKSYDNNNIIFESKTDLVNELTTITFEPAAINASNALSPIITENLSNYTPFTPQILGGTSSIQHLVLQDQNISVFWIMDLLNRTIEVDIAGNGTTIQEIASNTDNVLINHSTTYTIENNRLIIEEPFTFSLNGASTTISQINLDGFDLTSGSPICSSGIQNTPVYSGSIPGLGSISLSSTLHASSGSEFTPQTDAPYNVNISFIFGADGFALSGNGSIKEKFPSALAFVFNFGFASDDEPMNAVGFILEDNNGIRKTYLRAFDVVSNKGNLLQLSFKNEFYYSTTPTLGEEQSLIEVTDEIFESGEIYAYDFPITGLKAFNIYNPCNGYEFLLVQ